MLKRHINVGILILAILISYMMPISGVAAENTETILIYRFGVNCEGAGTAFTISAQPGTEVLLKIFYPQGTNPEFGSAASVMENIAYLNQKTADESGTVIFNFTANNVKGAYTAKFYGNLYSANFTQSGNTPAAPEQDDRLFMYLYCTQQALKDDCVNGFKITRRHTMDPEYYAPQIKKELDVMPEDRRVVYYDASLASLMYKPAETNGTTIDIVSGTTSKEVPYLVKDNILLDYIYGGEVENAYNAVFGLFEQLYLEGAKIDYAIGDVEDGVSNWYFSGLKSTYGAKAVHRAIYSLQTHEDYQTVLRPMLEAHGFPFSQTDVSDPEDPRGELEPILGNGYNIWNMVSRELLNKNSTNAIYEAMKAWYPHIKMSNYSSYDINGWDLDMDGPHHAWSGGSSHGIFGTHSSPVLYGEYNRYVETGPLDLSTYSYKTIRYYQTMVNMVNKIKQYRLNDANAKIMPWIYTYVNDGNLSSAYYPEFFLHIGLANPDPILLFGPSFQSLTDEQNEMNYQIPADLLADLNSLIGYSDRQEIITKESSLEQDYLLSGSTANGRSIWRISRNLENTDNFRVQQDEAGNLKIILDKAVTYPSGTSYTENAGVLTVGSDTYSEYARVYTNAEGKVVVVIQENSQSVTFAGGEIVTTTNAAGYESGGLWIAAPENCKPVEEMNKADRINGTASFAMLLFDTESGVIKNNLQMGRAYTAVIRYDNRSGNDIKMRIVAAKYKGDTLSTVEMLEGETARKGTDGKQIFYTSPVKEGENKMKIMLCNDDNMLIPIIEDN